MSEVSNFNTPTPGNAAVASQPRSFWSRYGWWLLILLLLFFGTPTFLKGCSTDFPLFGAPHQHSSQGPISEGPAVAAPEPSLTREALKQKDLSIFNGGWNLITSLYSDRTEELITFKFYFDKSGQGTATINEKNGNVCTGSANARIITENTFSLSYSQLQCTTGVYYKPGSANCRVHADVSKADCMLTCVSGECDTTFQRQ
jgi:hypothetical protein